MGKVPAITSPGSFDRCVTKATGQADESAWNKVKSLDNVQVLVKPVRFRIQAIYLEGALSLERSPCHLGMQSTRFFPPSLLRVPAIFPRQVADPTVVRGGIAALGFPTCP